MVTLLVTGAHSGNDRIEIIKPNGDVKTCPQSSNYPLEVRLAAGGYSNNEGSLSICGGWDGSRRSECYTLESSKWEHAGSLVNARSHHGASHITTGLWITGGWNGQRLASTELLLPDGKVTSGPNLPEARSSHCQVTYQDSTFIMGKCVFGQYQFNGWHPVHTKYNCLEWWWGSFFSIQHMKHFDFSKQLNACYKNFFWKILPWYDMLVVMVVKILAEFPN